jgi:hypothetical protein
MVQVEMLKGALVQALEPHQKGCHCAQGQAAGALPFLAGGNNQMLRPDSFKTGAEVVDVAENRYNVHPELRVEMVW